METYSEEEIAALMPRAAADANKYTRGRLQLFAGSGTYPGAACLAAVASQRAGAGYTEVFTDPAAVPLLQAYRASVVVRPFDAWHAEDERDLDEAHPRAMVVGSGFDVRDAATAEVLERVLEGAKAPVLVDGGALGALASPAMRELCVRRARAGLVTVATPHGGEAARLARGLDAGEGLDLEALAGALTQAYGMVVALKGPDTYICDGQRGYCMTEGTVALAKAGTGDVLAGAIGALLAQGVSAFEACVLGCTLHARAGVAAAERLGDVSVAAEDVAEALPEVIRAL